MNFVWLVVIKGVLDIIDRLIEHESTNVPANVQEKYAAFKAAIRETETV